MIRNILCPVDCSDCSRRALQFALALAKWHAARVNVLNVGRAVLLYPALVTRVSPAVVPTPTRAERAAHVARFLQPYATSHQPIDVILDEGDPAAAIVAVARSQAIDLIVMGTHGRGELAHLAFGSVAEAVVRTASCPVLVVPPGAHAAPSFQGFKRVLCSAASDRRYARLLTQADDVLVTPVPMSASYDDIVRAANEVRPDLIVCAREYGAIDILIRKAAVPVLSVNAAIRSSEQDRGHSEGSVR